MHVYIHSGPLKLGEPTKVYDDDDDDDETMYNHK